MVEGSERAAMVHILLSPTGQRMRCEILRDDKPELRQELWPAVRTHAEG